ncbi:MAG: response regulator transcription factor [Gammaproteobacteria bacterium]
MGQPELQALSEFLEAIYTAREQAAWEQQLVALLPRLTAADAITWHRVDLERRKTLSAVSCPIVAYGAGPEVFDAHMHEHPIVNHYAEGPEPGALKIRNFLSPWHYRRTALYHELYRSAGLEYQLTIRLDEGADTCTGVTLRRARRDFSERERELLVLLRPHLVQAYRNVLVETNLRQALGLRSVGNRSLSSVLSRREAQILDLVALGKSNKDIGQILNSSPRTVGKHLEHLFAKLGVHNRTAAMRWVETGQRASDGSSDEFGA